MAHGVHDPPVGLEVGPRAMIAPLGARSSARLLHVLLRNRCRCCDKIGQALHSRTRYVPKGLRDGSLLLWPFVCVWIRRVGRGGVRLAIYLDTDEQLPVHHLSLSSASFARNPIPLVTQLTLKSLDIMASKLISWEGESPVCLAFASTTSFCS